MIFYLLLTVLCAFAGYAIDRERGLALGAVFGVFGLIVAAILSTREPAVSTEEEDK